MTNLERIRNMDPRQLVELFRDLREEKLFEYIDWDRYFMSEDTGYCFIGRPAQLFISYRVYDCMVVGETEFSGRPYLRVILDGRVVLVSSDKVKIRE